MEGERFSPFNLPIIRASAKQLDGTDFSFFLHLFAQDTMMDCGGDDGGMEDFVDLATDITNSSPTIRGNLHSLSFYTHIYKYSRTQSAFDTHASVI